MISKYVIYLAKNPAEQINYKMWGFKILHRFKSGWMVNEAKNFPIEFLIYPALICVVLVTKGICMIFV